MDEATDYSGVNRQITDAVTQSNVKVVAEAPAIAISQIFQAIAHATGLMVENAANSQQQQSMLNGSAAAQGAIFLFQQAGIDAKLGATPPTGNASAEPAGISEPANLGANVQETAHQLKQLATFPSTVNSQILDAVNASHQYTLGAAGAFAHAQRLTVEAFVDGLERINAAEYRQQMQMVQIAATSVCLDAMLKSPERAEEYAAVLEAIKQLG